MSNINNGISILNKVHLKIREKKFTFDYIFPETTTQDKLFRSCIEGIMNDVMKGFNCTIFVYGHTGSGKTYTMEGTMQNEGILSNAGVIPRSILSLFHKIRNQKQTDTTISVSHLEIYNEELCDLLNDREEKLKIYNDSEGVNVKGLHHIIVESVEDIFKILQKSFKRRKFATTRLNKKSSRSHCIFKIVIRMKEITSITDEEMVKIGTLNLVDLAGNENMNKSVIKKNRTLETININRSLLTLGMVISSLVEKKAHIPYRESKLTRLLQESLGGKNKTLLIATISPASDVEIILNTLHYANKAKNIKNKPKINQRRSHKKLIQELMLKISRLERELVTQRHESGFIHFDKVTFGEIEKEIFEQEKKIKLLINFNENLRLEIDPFQKANKKKEELLKKIKTQNQILQKRYVSILKSTQDQNVSIFICLDKIRKIKFKNKILKKRMKIFKEEKKHFQESFKLIEMFNCRLLRKKKNLYIKQKKLIESNIEIHSFLNKSKKIHYITGVGYIETTKAIYDNFTYKGLKMLQRSIGKQKMYYRDEISNKMNICKLNKNWTFDLNNLRNKVTKDLDTNLSKVMEIKTIAEILILKVSNFGRFTEKIQDLFKKNLNYMTLKYSEKMMNLTTNIKKSIRKKKKELISILDQFGIISIKMLINLLEISRKQKKNWADLNKIIKITISNFIEKNNI